MTNRIGFVILAIVCIGLAVGLFATRKKATEEKAKDVDTIVNFSNKWVSINNDLEEQRQVNVTLTNYLSERDSRLLDLTNRLVATSNTLTQTEGSLRSTQEELTNRDATINALQSQNQELDQRALDLSTTITNLSRQIVETQRKLDSAEGDKEFLEKELKRLMAEKAELERRFNDLEVLRAQVKQLKEELSISRRLEWIRKGIFGDMKGAERMMKMTEASRTSEPTNRPQYNLNVEVQSDGTVKVIPALTNSPAMTNTPAPANQ